jgi:hypothetical protein
MLERGLPKQALAIFTISHHKRRFIRHYIEMVVVMFARMIVLGLPGEGALRAAGTSSAEFQANAPALALLAMAVIMTAPMVAWMRRMGHAWQPCNEMAASMFLPTYRADGVRRRGVPRGDGARARPDAGRHAPAPR